MRQTNDARVARWLGVVGELLREPLVEMPYVRICQELHETYDVVAVTWQWRTPDGQADFVVDPPDIAIPAGVRRQFEQPGYLNRHPLVHWFAKTGDPQPQTNQRVPSRIVPVRDRVLALRVLRQFGTEEQLSIPYSLGAIDHRAFVLARAGRDFSDDDLDVSRRLQPALVALDRQARLLRRFMSTDTGEAARRVGLTGRELAVLQLLAAGHTAFGIAQRLSSSPRTVHKHLENLYRKLGVHDRMMAVRMATELCLVSEDVRPTSPDHLRGGPAARTAPVGALVISR